MSDAEVKKAYEYLVPTDKLVVDAMIVALYQKDMKIRELVESITTRLCCEPEDD